MRDTFNVPYDLFPPLLIKLLITFGCCGHRGDIPQVLSAAWAQKNPRRGTSLSSPVCLSRSGSVQYPVCSSFPPKQHYSRGVITHWYLKVSFKLAKCRIQMVPFIPPPPPPPTSNPSPLWDPHSGCIVGGSAPLPAF